MPKLYPASRVLGLEVHGKDGRIGWVEEVYFDPDHAMRALLVELAGAAGSNYRLLAGSSWVDSIDLESGKVELFLDRSDVRRARVHEGVNVALDVVALLPRARARSRESAAA